MKKRIYSIYLKIKNMILSIKEFHEIHIGDLVVYENKKCFVNNGTRYDASGLVHYWDILECDLNKNGTRNKYYATDEELKRCLCLSNVKNALFYRYKWWKTCWYRIELSNMLSK